MPSIKDLRFDLGESVKIKTNGLFGNVTAIYLDGAGINIKVAFKLFRPKSIDDYGCYFSPNELEKI